MDIIKFISIISSSKIPSPFRFEDLLPKVHQLIATSRNLILFVDKDLWVCSLDMTTCSAASHNAKRHFMLLHKWKVVGEGGWKVEIEYIPLTREFVIVKSDDLFVVKRGLDFSEPWFA